MTSREDFSKQMWYSFNQRNTALSELENNPVDDKGKPLDEQQIEERRKQIIEAFYQDFESIKAQPGYAEAQKKHNEEIKARIASMLKPEDQKLLEELKNAKDVAERVHWFVTLTDKIPLDALAGIIPYYGDIGMSVLSTVLLIRWGREIGLSGKEIGKIIGFQVIDAAIGLIGLGDIIGNIADYFFKANKYSEKFFKDKIKELEEQAKEKGVDPKEIEEMEYKIESEGKKISILKDIIETFKKGINS